LGAITVKAKLNRTLSRILLEGLLSASPSSAHTVSHVPKMLPTPMSGNFSVTHKEHNDAAFLPFFSLVMKSFENL
jgi:hypothetical protein